MQAGDAAMKWDLRDRGDKHGLHVSDRKEMGKMMMKA